MRREYRAPRRHMLAWTRTVDPDTLGKPSSSSFLKWARVLNAVRSAKKFRASLVINTTLSIRKTTSRKCLTGLTACGSAAVNGLLLCPLLGFSHWLRPEQNARVIPVGVMMKCAYLRKFLIIAFITGISGCQSLGIGLSTDERYQKAYQKVLADPNDDNIKTFMKLSQKRRKRHARGKFESRSRHSWKR